MRQNNIGSESLFYLSDIIRLNKIDNRYKKVVKIKCVCVINDVDRSLTF